MAHTVTISRPTGEGGDPAFTFGGEHEEGCQAYRDCQRDWHRHPQDDNIVGDEWGNDRVGHHRYIDGDWMTPDGCALSHVFHSESPAEVFADVAAGTYPAAISWEGENWRLTVEAEVNAS